MALISEWMQQCGKKVLDDAGIVREACLEQLLLHSPACQGVGDDCISSFPTANPNKDPTRSLHPKDRTISKGPPGLTSGRRVSVDAGLNACYILVWCRHEVVGIVHRTQLEVGGLRRWIALSSILLVLVFNGLEATHTHATTSGNSSRCSICISVHSNAPAVAVHLLPVLSVVAIVAVQHQPHRERISTEPTLFIRPPPAI
jgi:hypothetical protein